MSFTEVKLLPRKQQNRLNEGLFRVMDDLKPFKTFYTPWNEWGLYTYSSGGRHFIHFDDKQDKLGEGLIHVGDGDYLDIDRIEHLNKEDCFIASKVYENAHHPSLEILRDFRDSTLKEYALGRAFINFYYSGAGKTAAQFLGQVPNSIPIIRKGLDALVEKIKN